MLTVTFDQARLTATQAGYRRTETHHGARAALRVRAMRRALEALARSLETRQRRLKQAGEPYLVDGRMTTLDTLLFAPRARQGWPNAAAAMLHGLLLPGRRLSPSSPDPHSYYALLKCGPEAQRKFSDLTGLVIYFDPLRRLEIAWIGLNEDVGPAIIELGLETKMLTDWSERAPEYALALNAMR
ncbi:MAG: hypothetical protein AAFX09_09020 [Pseudomonadota bacterium]